MRNWNYIPLVESKRLAESRSKKAFVLQWVDIETGEVKSHWVPKKLMRFNEDTLQWELPQWLFEQIDNDYETGNKKSFITQSNMFEL